nr:signal peptidase II [uncultured Anaerotignum sp.]
MKTVFAFLAVFGADLSSKKWAEKALPLNKKQEIVKNHLYFWHIKNSGIAYNRFSGKRKGILLSTGAVLAFYSGLLVRILTGRGEKRLALPLAITLGGGVANFWERLKKGRVTDFLFIRVEGKNAPIFNVADMAIALGAIWMSVIPFLKNKKK